MKRFQCRRLPSPKFFQIYDSHFQKLLAEFKPESDKINLHDMKNDKIQYAITSNSNSKDKSQGLCYSISQETNVVAELHIASPSPPTNGSEYTLVIKSQKFGPNIQVIFKNKTDFVAKRDGVDISAYEMNPDNSGYLDIAKGERRNFSFAFMALFIHFSEDHVNWTSTDKQQTKLRKTSKSGKSEEKSKEIDKSASFSVSAKKSSAKVTPREDVPSERSGRSVDTESNSTGSEESENEKDKKRKSTGKTRTVMALPPRSISGKKVPRATAAVQNAASRREQSSNSVLNALLKKNKEKPASDDNPSQNLN